MILLVFFCTFEFIAGPKAQSRNFWLVFRFFLSRKQLPPPLGKAGWWWVVVWLVVWLGIGNWFRLSPLTIDSDEPSDYFRL